MKISVSVSEADKAYLDAQTAAGVFESRSAAIATAIAQLRHGDLGAAYDEAFSEWQNTGEAEAWERVAGDGIG